MAKHNTPSNETAPEAEPAGAERAIVVGSIWRRRGTSSRHTVLETPSDSVYTENESRARFHWSRQAFLEKAELVSDPPSPPATSGEAAK